MARVTFNAENFGDHLDIMFDLLVMAFCAYVTWLALGFTIDNWDNPTSVLRLPMSIVYAGVLLGFALITWRYGQAALLRWRGTPIQPPEEG